MKQLLFSKLYAIGLLFVLLVSFTAELQSFQDFDGILFPIKALLLSCLVILSFVDVVTRREGFKFKTIFIFFVLAQFVNIVFSSYSYDWIKHTSTALSYIAFFWLFVVYFGTFNKNTRRELIEPIYIILFIALVVVVLASLLQGKVLATELGGRERYVWGFLNANRLSSFLFILINCGLFLFHSIESKIKKTSIIFSIIVLVLLLVLADSRTPMLLLIFEVPFIFALKHRLINKFSVLMLGVIISIILLCINFTDPDISFGFFDTVLSGRLIFWNNIVTNLTGFEFLFGAAEIDTVNRIEVLYSSMMKDNIFIDNFYLYIFFNFGIVGLISMAIFLGKYFFVIRKCSIRQYSKQCVALYICILLYGMTEGVIISINNVSSILFWLLLSSMIDGYDKSRKDFKRDLCETVIKTT